MLQFISGRPVLGPHVSLKYEAELRPLDRIGLSDIEMDAVLTLVLTHVEGCARTQAALERTQHDTGMTEVEWWVTHEPLLNAIVDPCTFPDCVTGWGICRSGTSGGIQSEYALTFGLERILAGIAELIPARDRP